MHDVTTERAPLLIDSSRRPAKLVWSLALPVLAEQMLTMLVGWSDAILTGQILKDEQFLAAITVDWYLLWLLESCAALIQTGALAIIARHVGAGEIGAANRVMVQSLILAAMLGVVLCIATLLSAETLVSFMRLTGPAHARASEYLKVVALCCPWMTVMLVGATCLRAAGYTLAGLWIVGAVNVVNVLSVWGLTVGLGPLPRLGWLGISTGTSIAFFVGGCLCVLVLFRGYGSLAIPRERPRLNLEAVQRILRIGVPGATQSLAVVFGHMWFVSIIAQLGDEAVAAHGVAIRCESVSWLTAEGFAVAAATLVGQSLGARRPDLARRYGWTALRIGIVSLSAMGVVFFVGSDLMFAVFVSAEKPDVRTQGAAVLRLVSFSMPALAVAIILTGALRGAGDTRWPLVYSAVGLAGVRIPLAYALALGAGGLGLYGAWIAMLVDLYVRGAAAGCRFLASGWMRARL